MSVRGLCVMCHEPLSDPMTAQDHLYREHGVHANFEKYIKTHGSEE